MSKINVAVLGDSIMWGQGLEEPDKFSSIAARLIDSDRHRVARYAHSGAAIGTAGGRASTRQDRPGDMRGEVPFEAPTLWQQLAGLDADDRFDNADIKLVLLNGGMNDVGALDLVNPGASEVKLQDRARETFEERFPPLLDEVAATFEHAAIIVPGYYPIFSDYSRFSALGMAEVSFYLGVCGIKGFVLTQAGMTKIIRHCEAFVETSDRLIGEAIDRVNATAGSERVAFARVDWPPKRSVFSPWTWIWGLGPARDLDVESDSIGDIAEKAAQVAVAVFDAFGISGFAMRYGPQDPVAHERFKAIQRLPKAARTLGNSYFYYASVGHPNRAGALAYAQSIHDTLARTDLAVDQIAPKSSLIAPLLCHAATS